MDIKATVTIERSWTKVIIMTVLALLLAYASYNSLAHARTSMRVASWITLCGVVPVVLITLARLSLVAGPALTISPEGIYDRLRRRRISWDEIKSIQRPHPLRYRFIEVDLFLNPAHKNYVSPVGLYAITTLPLAVSSKRLSELLNKYHVTYGRGH